jgi:hypothetical protein
MQIGQQNLQSTDENFTVVSTAALESIKRMVDKLQDERDKLLLALKCVIPAIADDPDCSGQYQIAQEAIDYVMEP